MRKRLYDSVRRLTGERSTTVACIAGRCIIITQRARVYAATMAGTGDPNPIRKAIPRKTRKPVEKVKSSRGRRPTLSVIDPAKSWLTDEKTPLMRITTPTIAIETPRFSYR